MSTTIESTKETNHSWPNYTYEATLEASDKIKWRVEDLIGGDKRLDFTSHSCPNRSPGAMHSISLVRGAPHPQSDSRTWLSLHIRPRRGIHSAVRAGSCAPLLRGNDARARAFLNFAGEEAKHIDLFKRFRADFLKFIPHASVK